jgi:hypothetical protein
VRSNDVIIGLVLVKLGQELGTDSPLARAVHDFVAALFALAR